MDDSLNANKESVLMDFSSAFKSKKVRKGKKAKKVVNDTTNDDADTLDDVNRDLEDELLLYEESALAEIIEIPRNLTITNE